MNLVLKISVVQAYIGHITGKTVQINFPTTVKQLDLLEKAYNKAIQYFKDNNGSITY